MIGLGLLAASPFAFEASAWADRMKAVNMTALSISLIRDEDVVSTQQIGLDRPLFQVGFLSRIPAVVSLLQLVDEKKVDLSRPANDYLKGWKIPTAGFRPTTVAELLTAQSGFDEYKFSGLEIGSPVPSLESLLKNAQPTFAPGTKVVRSATNELVIQKILQDVDGKTFSQVVQRRVFAPLGLKSTFYEQPLSSERENLVAPGEKPRKLYPQLAAQGMWSSSADVAKLLTAIMKSARGESKLLSAKSGKLLFTEVKDGATYGLNREKGPAGTNIYLGGQTDGYSVKIRLVPQDGTGVVVLTNANMGWSVIDDAIQEGFSRLSCLALEDSVASFEPRWASGPYAGREICPVCEYGLLPMALFWAQGDSDENIVAMAKQLQAGVTAAKPKKLKTFVVLSNTENNLPAALARATDLAKKAETPDVYFMVVKDSDAGPLRSYRIDRHGKNVLYLAANRSVKAVYRDAVDSSETASAVSRDLAALVSGN
jgi:CubicO group peptidase (beta-lactamase class C family)